MTLVHFASEIHPAPQFYPARRRRGRFEVEILDEAEFKRLNDELDRIDELYEPAPGEDEAGWLALRGPVLAALRRTHR